MSWEYCCPKCKSMLNPHKSIILNAAYGDHHVLIGLHPRPGKYDVYLPPHVTAEDGQRWDFFCPLCNASLETAEGSNLCELELWLDGQPLRILFSRIAGEHATFLVNRERVKERHGEDKNRYQVKVTQEAKAAKG